MDGVRKRGRHINFMAVSFTVVRNATTKLKQTRWTARLWPHCWKRHVVTHAYLRRHVEVVEMWECEWKEIRKEPDVKSFLAPAGRPRWTMTQQQILAAVVDGTLFGMVECDVRVPDELQDYFSEMQPVFKNTSVTRDDIGPFIASVCRRTRHSHETACHVSGYLSRCQDPTCHTHCYDGISRMDSW